MLKTHNRRGTSGRKARGFTLVEMLIVGALIALFSGLAVFNITTQLQINKQKASSAECRSLVTALAFAQQDLGYFPKLCFLNMSTASLMPMLNPPDTSTKPPNLYGLEYHSYPVSMDAQGAKLIKMWKGPYGGFSQDRRVKMTIKPEVSGDKSAELDWPADPFGNPYVVYLIKTKQVGSALVQKFIEGAGEDPNYFAAVVSYGRNRVPGLGNDFTVPQMQARLPYRAYREISPTHFEMLTSKEFTGAQPLPPVNGVTVTIDDIISMVKTGLAIDSSNPRVRELGSDDRYVEF